MAKPPEAPPSEGAPEWMVSYADMITIMMAFFVVMYAMAPKKDKEDAQSNKQRLMDSIYERFGPEFEPFGSLMQDHQPPRTKNTERGYGKLIGDPPQTDSPERQTERPARIRIPGSGQQTRVGGIILFEDGTTEMSLDELARLRAVAREFAGKPHKIEVIGHASRRPLPKGSHYKDHIDLGYARARRTMELLVEMGIERERMRITSAGSAEPLPPEAGVDPLFQNSRVETYLMDLVPEPPAALATTQVEESKTAPADAEHANADKQAPHAQPDHH